MPWPPKEPVKPNIKPVERDIVERFYVYHYNADYNHETKTWETFKIDWFLDNKLPTDDEYGEPLHDYCEAHDIPLKTLLDLLKQKGIAAENVTISNELYYRKSPGHLVLEIKRTRSDEEYNALLDVNRKLTQAYETALAEYPTKLKQYEKDKRNHDILATELRLKQLKEGKDV